MTPFWRQPEAVAFGERLDTTFGSATMVRTLLAADLVDELLLTIEPIILGGGKTIFADNGKALPFTLDSTARASTGAQVCRHVRAR